MDLNDLIRDLEADRKGLAFIVFPISARLLNDFPVPRSEIVESFLNFSDDPSSEDSDPRQFNPRLHLFRVSGNNTLCMGMLGSSPQIYQWAQDWLENLQDDPRYATELRHAKLMMAQEMIEVEEPTQVETNDDPFHGTALAYTDDELEANEKDSNSEN